MPYDVDIIREQVRQGKFKYLDDVNPEETPIKDTTPTSSEHSNTTQTAEGAQFTQDDDRRPIYPPSVTHTAGTHNDRSQNNSDGTEYTGHQRFSAEHPPQALSRQLSMDRPRPSYDRMRTSMDHLRPSFEASRDLTSVAQLTRVESSQSDYPIRKRLLPSKLR